MVHQTLYIAIPAMDEKDYLFQTLDCIVNQQCSCPIRVFVCVNQPEAWWDDDEKIFICENNQKTIVWLQNYKNLSIEIIDCSSKGKGWKNKKNGVGQARKELTNKILSVASDNDIFISMDADTLFGKDYFQSIVENFHTHPSAVGIAVPYYHKKNDSEVENKAMLRYELYLRNYNLHLLRIGSPHAYTALGSAICCTVKACRAVGGFDSQTSGEDFYFLQKLVKYGNIIRYNNSKVYPATRFSSRVPFGTGPAMYNGSQGDWDSYPIFHYSGFDSIEHVYKQIERLFYEDFESDFLDFLQIVFSGENSWQPLRKNYKTLSSFTKAFHTKADGLRIFQFLRQHQRKLQKTDEQCLLENMQRTYPEKYINFFLEKDLFSFQKSSVEQLDSLRNFFMERETIYQKLYDETIYR